MMYCLDTQTIEERALMVSIAVETGPLDLSIMSGEDFPD